MKAVALITCPECNRENVSDSAETCPKCGFGIKKYFDEKRASEERYQKAIQEKERETREYQARVSNIKDPEKPKIRFGCLSLTILPFLYGVYMNVIGSDKFYNSIGYLAIGVGLICLYIIFKQYSDSKINYQEYLESPEKYRKMMADRRMNIEKTISERNAEKESKVIYCPNCKKPTGEKLSTLGKAASVSAFGVASNKIGKTYQCRSCEYLWWVD